MTHKQRKKIACYNFLHIKKLFDILLAFNNNENCYTKICVDFRYDLFSEFLKFHLIYLEKFNEDVILINVFHPSTILMRLAQRS